MNRIKIRDFEVIPGSLWCKACKRSKAKHIFGRTYCKECERRKERERKSTPEAKARRRANRVKNQKKLNAYYVKWRSSDRGKATIKAWCKSLQGRLSEQLKTLRKRLKKAKTPEQIKRLQDLIKQLNIELNKIRIAKNE